MRIAFFFFMCYSLTMKHKLKNTLLRCLSAAVFVFLCLKLYRIFNINMLPEKLRLIRYVYIQYPVFAYSFLIACVAYTALAILGFGKFWRVILVLVFCHMPIMANVHISSFAIVVAILFLTCISCLYGLLSWVLKIVFEN